MTVKFSPRAMLAVALTVSLSVGSTVLLAQQNPSDVPTMTIRANTRMVTVDVIVRDKQGQPKPGLKAEDFTIEENGKKQKIAVFVAPGSTQQPAQTPPPPGVLSTHPEHIGPNGAPTVLLLDALNSPFKDQVYGRSQMLKYVVEQSQGGHPMAVVTLTDRLRVLQQFTSDPQILLAAIKAFRPQEQVLQASAPQAESSVPSDTGGKGAGIALAIATARAEVDSFANAQTGYSVERRTLITLDGMRALIRILGGLPGRKSVVWLTSDFPFDLIPEDRNISDTELAAELPGQGRQRSAALNGSSSIEAEARMLHSDEIKAAQSQLASANIAIYPVDLRGLVGGMESLASYSGAHNNDIHGAGLANAATSLSGSLIASQDTMREVAAETGGKAYMNENEIKQGVALAVADDNASYTIGYYPENKKWDGKYRSIKIKLAQGGTEVRYRKGYFAEEEKKPNYEQDVAAVLTFNSPSTQISFMAQAKSTDPGKVHVTFLVDAHTLIAEDAGGSKKMDVTLYTTVFGADNKMLANKKTTVTRTFDAATYQQIVDHGMMVPVDLDLPSGGKQLRLAVMDNKTGFIGATSGPLGQ